MRKKIFFVLLLIVITFLILFFLFSSSKKQGDEEFPTPTPIIQKSGEAQSGAKQSTDPTIIENDRRSALVIQLGQKLPYHGVNFSFYYNYANNQFILYLNPFGQSEGNKEFDTFLKQNGVENRSWIENLVAVNDQPTPEP